jgi:aspartate racemase
MRVTLGVITCNTAHIYFEEIESKVKYPLISIVEQTKNELAQSHYSSSASIGILATDATIKFDLYGKPLNTVGISTIYPNNGEQELVSKAIFDPRIGIKSTAPHISRDSSNYLAFVMKQMNQRHGVETFLAGCTELSIACSHALASEFKIIDPLEILARSCLAKLNFSEGAPNNIESQRKFA